MPQRMPAGARPPERRRSRSWAARAAAAAAGAILGVLALALAGTAVAHRLDTPDRDPGKLIEATHLPPLLTAAPGDAAELRFDVYCAAPDGDPESAVPCDAGGALYARAGDEGPFRALPLRLDEKASEGRYVATVPQDIASASDGFSYYAVLRNNRSQATTVLPDGGASAPYRSRSLENAVAVRLGRHVFGATRRPSERVAATRWGGGAGEAGLEQGPQLQPIGASSFDVDASGTVTLLDEANRRALRFRTSTEGGPETVPLDIRGTIADLAVGADGGMTVLETVGDEGAAPFVRSFDAVGRARGAWRLAGRASALRSTPGGLVALEYPAGQWMPVTLAGRALAPDEQRARGRVTRTLASGADLVVQREEGEARVALVGQGGVRRSWRLESATPLGEIQLAEEVAGRVVVVLRVYTDTQDEFEVLVLGPRGVVDAFAVESTAWAETAPLSRFRLRDRSLYALGSTPSGPFVDRYDLEVS